MAIDRRAQRTRTALYEALLSLTRQKSFERITVAEILAEAGIGRATFYAHFESKDDLLARSLDRLRVIMMEAPTRGVAPSRALFEHVREHAEVRAALSGGRAGAIVDQAVDEVLAQVLRSTMPVVREPDVPRDLAIRQAVSTLNCVMAWWEERRPDMSAKDVDLLFRRLLGDGPAAVVCEGFVAETSLARPDAGAARAL